MSEKLPKFFVRTDKPESYKKRKALAIAALEVGFSGLIVRKEDSELRSIGITDCIVLGDDSDISVFEINSPGDLTAAIDGAKGKKMAIIAQSDWKIVPLENILAHFQGSETLVYAQTSDPEEAALFLRTMEHGADGIVICAENPAEIASFSNVLEQPEDVELLEAEIISVKRLGNGDRVCVDTCSIMNDGEGMLVGSMSESLFLIQSESEDNGYVAPRPFRVNAGAVHSYAYVPGGKTEYLSSLKGGDSVVIADRDGKTRRAVVGRCKIEVRPLICVQAVCQGKECNVILQNAETVRLVTREGSISVCSLKKGDKVLVSRFSGGRHLGIKVEETIVERRNAHLCDVRRRT